MSAIASPARYRAALLRSCIALTASAALGISTVAGAQAPAPTPPSRADLAIGRPPAPQSRNRVSVESSIERGPCPLADPGFSATKVTFSTVAFTGLPGVPATTLAPAWRDYAGRELPIASLCEVRDRAATILRSLGFLAAVQVPPQRIEAGGTVHMDVLAARLVEIQIRGEPGPSEQIVAAHLKKLTGQPFFNSFDAERQLLLLGDLPGYNVRLVLRSADAAPGEVIGDIVLERTPVELVVGVSNLASHATGREAAFAALTLNDLVGLGDRTTLSYYQTIQWKEQRIARIANELALGSNGLRLGTSLLLARSRPDVGANFRTNTLAGEIGLTYPLVRRQAKTLIVGAGLELVDQKLAFGSVPLSEDRLRVARAQLDYSAIDPGSLRGIGGFSLTQPRWRSTVSVELRRGLDALGASRACVPLTTCLPPNVPISNFLADPSAFVARMEGQFEYRPVPRATLMIAPLAQWSDAPLLSYEQASLGNYTIGRGFDPGVVLGDRVLGASTELRYGNRLPHSANALALEPFVFLDYAKAWLDKAAGTARPRAVLSSGGGVRARWGDLADLSLLLAVPLKRAGYQAVREGPRLLFTLTSRLLPWRKR